MVFQLGELEGWCFGGCATGGLDVDVGEFDVFDIEVGDAAEDGAVLHRGVVALEVADKDTAKRAYVGGLFGAAQARSETEEDGAGDEIAHRDVGDGDVFEERAIFGFKSDALAALEDAVGDGGVDEAAVGFCSELDAAGVWHAIFGSELLEGAVEDGA